jgi:hypothetical protein
MQQCGCKVIDPTGGKKSRTTKTEHFRVSSVERASTNVDFLPDLAPLQNGAIFLLVRAILVQNGSPRCAGAMD